MLRPLVTDTKPVMGTVSNLWKVGIERVKEFMPPQNMFPITFLFSRRAYKSILSLTLFFCLEEFFDKRGLSQGDGMPISLKN